MDSASIVIKVKYGKTLRRFNARIDEAGNLDLSLDGLVERVVSMFSLSPDADVTLTYLDEDGDLVTLAEDEDLKDVMRQSLNPLRITVKVNSESGSNSSNARSSGNSTPMRSSPRVSQPLPDLSKSVSEIFKAVPEPLGEALTKISLDLASKATASSSQLPEIVQQFSKMLQSVIPVSDSQVGKVPTTQTANAESSTPSPLVKEPEASGGDSAKAKVAAIPISINKPQDTVSSPLKKNTFVAPEFSSSNISADHRGNGKEVAKKSGEGSSKAKEVNWGKPAWGNIKAVASSVIGAEDKDVMKPFTGWNPPGLDQCPFSGTPVENERVVPNTHFSPRVHPFKRSFSRGSAPVVFHRGVQCDGCGVHPISGPRFKSKVKENYDLCSICFAELGSEADYIRMDYPVLRHQLFKKRMDLGPQVIPPTMPQVLRGAVKPIRPKLDSRFILDVNVVDGTIMAPLTPFTKIWRMRNNGTLVWPQGTQIVWIGGDKLSGSISAGLQIPAEGLAVENELEIAVDFKAPELPGRYISYWRMASPSGQKFGQRVWVLIQVDASVKDSAKNDNWQGLNLNFPPENSDFNEAESESSTAVPVVVNGRLPTGDAFNNSTDLVEPLVVPPPTKNQDHDFPINDNLFVNSITPRVMGPPRELYPTVDSSAVPPPLQPVFTEASAQASGEEDDVEEVLLMTLKEMGFKEMELNKEILRKNQYDLQQSVDALCGVSEWGADSQSGDSEWDPILEELQEMGFCDDEMNKKLLKKNKGSIKGAVMDLITGVKP